MRRFSLFTASAIAAAALVWFWTGPRNLGDSAPGQGAGGVAAEQGEQVARGPDGLRRGAGTVGLPGRRIARKAGTPGVSAGPGEVPDYPRAPDPSEGPDLSGVTPPDGGDGSSSEGSDSASVVVNGVGGSGGNAPSSQQPGTPPDPTVIAGLAAPAVSTPDGLAPPIPDVQPGDPAPTDDSPAPAQEGVEATGPLSDAEIAARAEEVLADVTPEQRDQLREPVIADIKAKTEAACAMTGGCTPTKH